jgi:phosphatidylserine/phosphatidylglycerophosphate/cardiolipin synthase-like enzyme
MRVESSVRMMVTAIRVLRSFSNAPMAATGGSAAPAPEIRVAVVQASRFRGEAAFGRVGGGFAAYTVQVAIRGTVWAVHRRYRQFRELYAVLKRTLPLAPEFPPKTWFPDTSEAFVRWRRGRLHAWLSSVVARADAWRSHGTALFEFLGMSALSLFRPIGPRVQEGWMLVYEPAPLILATKPSTLKDLAPRMWVVLGESCLVWSASPVPSIPDLTSRRTPPFIKGCFLFDHHSRIERDAGSDGTVFRLWNSTHILQLQAPSPMDGAQWARALATVRPPSPSAAEAASNARLYPSLTPSAGYQHPFASFAPWRTDVPALPLLDGRSTFQAAANAILRARSQIIIAGWWVDPATHLVRPSKVPLTDTPVPGGFFPVSLAELLLVKANQGVPTFLLLYKDVSLANMQNDSRRSKNVFQALHPLIHVVRHPFHSLRGASTGSVLFWSHHEKVVVVDQSIAIVGGMDFCPGRYDDQHKALSDMDWAIANQHSLVESDEYQNVSPWSDADYYNPGLSDSIQSERSLLLKSRSRVMVPPTDVAPLSPTEEGATPGATLEDGATPGATEEEGATPGATPGVTVEGMEVRPASEGRATSPRMEVAASSSVRKDATPEQLKTIILAAASKLEHGAKKDAGRWSQLRMLPPVKQVRFESTTTPPAVWTDIRTGFPPPFDRKKHPRMPWQDIACLVGGSIARDIALHLIQRWNHHRLSKSEVDLPILLPLDLTPATLERPLTVPVGPPSSLSDALSMSSGPCFWSIRSKHKTRSAEELTDILRSNCPAEVSQLLDGAEFVPRVSALVLRSIGQWSVGIPERLAETSVQAAYVHLLMSAERFAYVENQFFMATPGRAGNAVAEALFRRLHRALSSEGDPFRAVLVLPCFPEGDVIHNTAVRAVLANQYRTLFDGPTSIVGRLTTEFGPTEVATRMVVLSLRQAGSIDGRLVSEMVYVHSKLLIVDDRVAVLGSANINDRSLLGNRDSELSVALGGGEMVGMKVDVRGSVVAVSSFVAGLRAKIWASLFGLTEEGVTRQVRFGVASPRYYDCHGKAFTVKDAHSLLLARCASSQETFDLIRGVAETNTRFYERHFPGLRQFTQEGASTGIMLHEAAFAAPLAKTTTPSSPMPALPSRRLVAQRTTILRPLLDVSVEAPLGLVVWGSQAFSEGASLDPPPLTAEVALPDSVFQ